MKGAGPVGPFFLPANSSSGRQRNRSRSTRPLAATAITLRAAAQNGSTAIGFSVHKARLARQRSGPGRNGRGSGQLFAAIPRIPGKDRDLKNRRPCGCRYGSAFFRSQSQCWPVNATTSRQGLEPASFPLSYSHLFYPFNRRRCGKRQCPGRPRRRSAATARRRASALDRSATAT
jgi:hypothetical protein